MDIWYKIRGYLAVGVALITCPCHLVLILPLILSVTAGTAVGGFLEQNYGLVLTVSIIAFIGGLVGAVRWLGNAMSENGAFPPKQPRTLLKHLPHIGSLQQDKWISSEKRVVRWKKNKIP
jgi:mercuric ion transport protein